jgi:hypothetical protein
MKACPDDLNSVLVVTLPRTKPGIAYGHICDIMKIIIQHRPCDAVQLLNSFKATLTDATLYGNAIAEVVSVWEAVCASGQRGQHAIEEGEALMQLFLVAAGVGANCRGEREAANLIEKYFAPLSIIYDFLGKRICGHEFATISPGCYYPGLDSPERKLRKEAVILISAARMRQSLWSIKDGTALRMMANIAARLDRNSHDKELPQACRHTYEVLRVKYVRICALFYHNGSYRSAKENLGNGEGLLPDMACILWC